MKEFNSPYHSAISISVNDEGGVGVVEQNVKPKPRKIKQNTIARLEYGNEISFQTKNGVQYRTEIKVTGSVWAYRSVIKKPVMKKKVGKKAAHVQQSPRSRVAIRREQMSGSIGFEIE